MMKGFRRHGMARARFQLAYYMEIRVFPFANDGPLLPRSPRFVEQLPRFGCQVGADSEEWHSGVGRRTWGRGCALYRRHLRRYC
jgi:hypothetical protein